MKKVPFHISAGLLGACVLLLLVWEYRLSLDEAKVNYRNESHNLALGDEAKLVQKLSWMQAALTLVSRDQVIETFVAAGGPLPPMARSRVQPAFELLAENSEAVSISVFSFNAEGDELLLRIDTEPSFELPDQDQLVALAQRFKNGARSFQAVAAGGEFFFYACPITHHDLNVGMTVLSIRFEELRRGMSSLAREIEHTESGLSVKLQQASTAGTDYSETLQAAPDWRIRFARPDSDFRKRADVAKARQAALLHAVIVVMGVVAAISLAQRRAARAASRAKSEFLSNISHEVRAPLNGVLGMTELVLKTEVTPLQREYLNTVSSSAECVLNLVNDLLDLSKVESGVLELDPVEVSLEELFSSALLWYRERAQEKGVNLVLDLDERLVERVRIDPLRVRQVLTNLVSNAVKFTPEGEVTVTVRQLGPELVSVEVTDTGIGISPDHMERIFEPFQQAGGHITRNYGGTGLGLSICRELVGLLGGRLEARSEPERGSSFTFTFRAPVVGEALETPRTNDSLKVLVVDDGPINRKLVKSILEEWGYGVVTCRDGAEALAALGKDKYDLVLLDLQMPEIDGFQVARTMRGRGDTTPVVALTGNALSQDRQKCLESGMDAHIAKPIDENRLRSAIRRVLSHVGENAGVPAAGGVFDPKRSLRRVGGDPRILERVITLFMERYDIHLHALRAAVDEPEEFAEAVRRLRTAVAPFAADRLTSVLASERKSHVSLLEKELEALKSALQEFVSEHDS